MPATTAETLSIVNRTVTVAPLVLLSVADHYGRSAKGTKKRVLGVLLGQNDGKSVRVLVRIETLIEGKAGRRRVCASREQQVSLAGGRLVSHGRTDTIRRCPRLP